MEITSVNNNLVKETVKLQQKRYRTETGKFLLEGYKSVKEAYDSGIKLERVFVISSKIDKYDFPDCEIISTNESVLKKISTTESFPESVGVAFQPENNLDVLKKSKRVILLENIADAGNLGTIIRTASAFETDSVVLYGDTVDLYNPKCVRSTVGNLWKTNIVHLNTIDELDKYFSEFERIATLPKCDNTIWLNDWVPSEKILVMFGSEANGLSEELKQYATKSLTIEMSDSVESLNLSISVGILLYKINTEF